MLAVLRRGFFDEQDGEVCAGIGERTEQMSEKDTGGSFHAYETIPISQGISLRDWLAGMAIQGIALHCGEGCDGYIRQRVQISYQFADAMLKERSK